MCGGELLVIRSVQAEAGVTCSKPWLGELATHVWDQSRRPLRHGLAVSTAEFRDKYLKNHQGLFQL